MQRFSGGKQFFFHYPWLLVADVLCHAPRLVKKPTVKILLENYKESNLILMRFCLVFGEKILYLISILCVNYHRIGSPRKQPISRYHGADSIVRVRLASLKTASYNINGLIVVCLLFYFFVLWMSRSTDIT